mmetsp:Transcript_52242/g.46923  ORF Transcript_52242/g.46923 Transcript_52242/m.46923 type:complete len:149 (+) Transcript_52242:115-561(+)
MEFLRHCVVPFCIIISIASAGYSVPISHAQSYVGQSIGSGECAAGVQTVFYYYYNYWPLGLTSTWTRGKKVLGDYTIPTGTAIASFNDNGKYDCTFGCHAAIYISQDSIGNTMKVYDQYSTKNWGVRTLYLHSSNPQSNSPDRFYVIE